MARKGDIEIPIAIDTGGVQKSINNGLIDPIEDAEEALEALAKVDAGKDIDRDLKRAQDATEDLDDELDRTRKSLDKLGYAAKGAGDDTKRGMERATEGVEDFKGEANQAARETAASFDGSAESVGDLFQEVAANAFVGFGPAGAAAGLAAATGIGLAIAGFESLADAREASEEEIAKWADAYIEAGGRVLTASQIAASAQEIVTDPERWKAAQKNAETWGVSIETAVLAASGHAPSLDVINASLEKQRAAFVAATDAGKLNMEERDKELAKIGEATTAYDTLRDGMAQGQAAANVYSQSLRDLIDSTAGATHQTDDLGNKVYSLPGGKQILVEADTGRATENLDAFKGDLDEVPVERTMTLKAVLDDAAIRGYRPPTIKVPATFTGRDGRQLF